MAKFPLIARCDALESNKPSSRPITGPSSKHIPNDVWIYIAEFIPSKTLRNLYSINSLFLDLALNERYKEVNFLQINYRTIEFLEHISDPNISSRVRRLRINPVWFNLESTSPKISLRDRLVLSIRSRRSLDALFSACKKAKRRNRIDALTTDLVVHLFNVTTFILVTRYQPHPKALALFLSKSWAAFGSNLRRLTLNAPLGDFAALLPSPFALVSLEELTLRFSTDLSSDDPAVDTEILTNVISPFLQQISPRLKNLNLMSSALGDHSILFHTLGHMSSLTTLSLNIGFYPPLLQDISGLTKFLNWNSRNLKHVKLQPLEIFRVPSLSTPAHDHFVHWMSDNAANKDFLSNLQTFVVLPSTEIPASSKFNAAILYIPRSQDTLTNLIIGESCLSFSELNTLVSALSHRPPDRGLKILHVQLFSLNPQVFDLLAAKLPGLDDLDIKFNTLLPDDKEEMPLIMYYEEPVEEVSFLSLS
ncbi:hypothetical protein H0H81_003970 [Sphagnurus paluster]|uniref:F-box domain-containing protein n=1 Tax=Sphagnurus paluster TaxID=117069 RepID=A0A9P7GL93_9AGAR|nr:hypothetical protein H0H81_003970 [Sphagnurus paluster]